MSSKRVGKLAITIAMVVATLSSGAQAQKAYCTQMVENALISMRAVQDATGTSGVPTLQAIADSYLKRPAITCTKNALTSVSVPGYSITPSDHSEGLRWVLFTAATEWGCHLHFPLPIAGGRPQYISIQYLK